MFQGETSDRRSYYSEMNSQCFTEWLEDTLLPALNQPSCLVMDSAGYQNMMAFDDKAFTSTSTKDEVN